MQCIMSHAQCVLARFNFATVKGLCPLQDLWFNFFQVNLLCASCMLASILFNKIKLDYYTSMTSHVAYVNRLFAIRTTCYN